MQKVLITAADLWLLPEAPGKRYELVRGELIEMTPSGTKHGAISGEIVGFLHRFVRENNLGYVFSSETGFIVERDPDTVLAPDAAFIAEGKLPGGELPDGYLEAPPDLVVEVVSPSDSYQQVEKKAAQWLVAGAYVVWVVNPSTKSVAVWRAPNQITYLTGDDELDAEPALPGFRIKVSRLFPA